LVARLDGQQNLFEDWLAITAYQSTPYSLSLQSRAKRLSMEVIRKALVATLVLIFASFTAEKKKLAFSIYFYFIKSI